MKYGFEVCESDESLTCRTPQASTQSVAFYRNGLKIPKKPRIYDSPRKKVLRRRIINLKKKNTRLRKKVTNMKDLIMILSKKNILSEENCDRMREIFLGDSAKIFDNQAANLKKPLKGRRYCKEIKHFALTLHFYSPKAYEFCR